MTEHNKIKSVQEVAKEVSKLRGKGKKVAHCHGCFDLMHPGHIRHFAGARELADALVVTVTPDRFVDKGPKRPVFNETLRAESIASLACVDFVAVNEWPTAEETLRVIKPDYYVKGQEFEGKEDVTGKLQGELAVVREVGAEMRYTHDIVFSSSSLLNENFGLLPDDLKEFLASFKDGGYADKVWGALDRLRGMKALVIGDAIIDDYHYCLALNKATKANVITSQYLREEAGVGGAMCIANHLSSFCDDVTLISCFGSRDTYLDYSRENLADNVKLLPFVREGAHTTRKRRYVDNVFRHKVFEIHFYDDSPIEEEMENRICERLSEVLPKVDLVIVGDFGHGLMTTKVIDAICRSGAFLAATVQTNSNNYGFNYVTKYPRADYVAIDEREVRLACHDRESPLPGLVEQLSSALHCQRLAVTLGREGSMVLVDDRIVKVPIVTSTVVDTVGAGDAFLSLSAPAAAQGVEPEVLLFMGNVAGAMAANTVGNNMYITNDEFRKFVDVLLK